MSTGAGVLRSAASLALAAKALAELARPRRTPSAGPEAWQATNLHTVACALVAAATAPRRETRGAHWREDFPADATRWRGHLTTG